MHERLILSKIFLGAALRIIFLWGVAGTITVVPNVPQKGNTVTLNIVSTGTVNWIRNGVTLTSCLIAGGFCTPSSSGNMAFSANSLASSSTMSITGAAQALNGGDYEVAGERRTLTINSPISSVDLIEQNIKDTLATLVAKIQCVFPMADLQVTIYKIVENGGNSSEVLSNNLVEADNSSCASHESAFNVTKTYRPGPADETFRVKVCGKHLSLNMETCSGLSSLITFKGSTCKDCDLCWILNSIDKIICLILFILVDLCFCGLSEILSRKYKGYFRLDYLEIILNKKSAEIKSFQILIDDGIVTGNLINCGNTGRYQCDVTLNHQQNLTFYFNFQGFDKDRNVARSIEFEKSIKLGNHVIPVQWSYKRNTGKFKENAVLYQSEGDTDDIPVIKIYIVFELTIPDLEKRVKIRIYKFIIICCVISLLIGIITGIFQNKQFDGFCCKELVIPVLAVVGTLLAIFLYCLLLVLLLYIRHKWWIVVKSWKESSKVHNSHDIPDTDMYIRHSVFDDTNNFQTLVRANLLQPIKDQGGDPDNPVTENRKKNPKGKKKKKSEEEINDTKIGLEDTM